MKYFFQGLKNNKHNSNIDINAPVVIFSFGIIGITAYHVLVKKGIDISLICDNDQKKWGLGYDKYIVKSPQEIQHLPSTTTIFIASKYNNAIESQLNEMGYNNIVDCTSIFGEFDLEIEEIFPSAKEIVPWFPTTIQGVFQSVDLYMYDLLNNKSNNCLYIKSIDVVVTEKCSLKCQDCSNLMQYYESPSDADYQLLCNSIKNIMNEVDYLCEFRILGGEPFLYKRLEELLNYISEFNNKGSIIIMTNGTILPKSNVLEVLEKVQASVVISDYGNISKKSGELQNKLRQRKIPFILNRPKVWQDCAYFILDSSREQSEVLSLFDNCCVKDALTLLKEKLYRCPFSAHAENLRAIQLHEEDSISLNRNTLSKENLRNFYLNKFPIKACFNCTGRQFDTGNVPPARQTKSPLPYTIQGEAR
jgi:organic radical activating enzyme